MVATVPSAVSYEDVQEGNDSVQSLRTMNPQSPDWHRNREGADVSVSTKTETGLGWMVGRTQVNAR